MKYVTHAHTNNGLCVSSLNWRFYSQFNLELCAINEVLALMHGVEDLSTTTLELLDCDPRPNAVPIRHTRLVRLV